MGQYIVRYGLGGGFGGADSEEIIDAPNLDQANLIAYEMACEVYDSYDGMHGLQSFEDLREEYPDYSDEDIDQMWVDARESWLEYSAEPLNNQYDDEYEEDDDEYYEEPVRREPFKGWSSTWHVDE